MEQYERHLEVTNGKRVLEDLFGRQLDQWTEHQIAAFLHLYTYKTINYEERHAKNRRFRSLKDIYQNGGNCEEKTVFLTSLLKPVSGINCRAVSVKRDGAYHLLLQLQFPRTSHSETVQRLAEFYTQTEKIKWDGGQIYHEGPGRPWFFADPEMSSYLGDISTLNSKGYLTTSDDGSWEWSYPNKAAYMPI